MPKRKSNPLIGKPLIQETDQFSPYSHYSPNSGPTREFGDLTETPPKIKNIGWTLGNECPYRCTHCYSMNSRVKGANMTVRMIDRIVHQLHLVDVETVNLGGNEPLFTNGANPKDTLLPYIIQQLVSVGISVGLTTSGITLLRLFRDHKRAFYMLNDVDVSLDSPIPREHNANRGANLFSQAVNALKVCQENDVPHSVIMCGMNWNFTIPKIEALVDLAKEYGANVRINPIKPIQPQHMEVALSSKQYFDGFRRLLELCDAIDLGEPPIAAVTEYPEAKRCPCGRTSFRIHSITPEGKIFVSPCVYLHDYKSSMDLLTHDLYDIIHSPEFKVFRQRNANPEEIIGCKNCELLNSCGGGCTARSYLHNLHTTGQKSMLVRDPYCPIRETSLGKFKKVSSINTDQRLVHMDYLCTWIGRPI